MTGRAVAWGMAFFFCSGNAMAGDPPLKPGRDPGGVAVAVLADGFDYRLRDVADVLARDGEGVAIAWDSVDQDALPFRADGKGADAVRAAAALGGVRVIATRVDLRQPVTVIQGIAFAASTPARIVTADVGDDEQAALGVLVAAAKNFTDHVFVVSLARTELPPGAKGVDNFVLVPRGASGSPAAEAVARVLGCGRGELGGGDGAQRGREFRKRLGQWESLARQPGADAASCDHKRGPDAGQQK
ncbi:hypothetical protein [Hyphomicrobium sp.]|uniref:hypothetical protein n=1 Tax=Hyphomicrobium sp. TaxID=82 RepID=UPI003F72BFC2